MILQLHCIALYDCVALICNILQLKSICIELCFHYFQYFAIEIDLHYIALSCVALICNIFQLKLICNCVALIFNILQLNLIYITLHCIKLCCTYLQCHCLAAFLAVPSCVLFSTSSEHSIRSPPFFFLELTRGL